ncbi:hypothetical protein C8Q74DRAFT_1214003 [Fomes fomentarius]|nr:hypothetical protein C8Q74DRAFT_1214003 [Fomes fomentarius]
MYFTTIAKLALAVAFAGAVVANPSSFEARDECSATCKPGDSHECMKCPHTMCAEVMMSSKMSGACVPDTCAKKMCKKDADCDMKDCPDIKVMGHMMSAHCDKLAEVNSK